MRQRPVRGEILPPAVEALPEIGASTEAYQDYGRFLTPEGGVLIIFKDLDQRIIYTLWRLLAWAAATGGDGWFIYAHSPVQNWLINVVCWITIAIYNWLIVAKPFEIYRRIELRSDCLILDGGEVFFVQHMPEGAPQLAPDEDGNLKLCGVYGTRFVEYATIRRFDEEDRMPEAFAAHLQAAIQQLWMRPYGP